MKVRSGWGRRWVLLGCALAPLWAAGAAFGQAPGVRAHPAAAARTAHAGGHAGGAHRAGKRASVQPVAARKAVPKRVVARAARPAPRPAAPLRPLVVVDAGHGGADGGSVGVTGLRESQVTLATALELRRVLLATHRVRVRLTRDGDRALSLAQRVAFVRRERPALFISIHADASPDRRAHGASVYVRANRASGAEITRLPARSANAGAPGRAMGRVLGQAPAPGTVLLQRAMVSQLQDAVPMAGAPARQAHLYVLGVTGVPSVLVETGFLSNRREEALLRSRAHRLEIARAIRDAVLDTLDGVAGPADLSV